MVRIHSGAQNFIIMEKYTLKVWNHKYNQFCPCCLVSKLDDKIVKIHGIATLKDPVTKQIYTEEFETCTFWKNISDL